MMQIALLRGINVGGNKMVAMTALRDLLAALGFTNVRSLLQSGNLVFEGDRQSGAALERLLETETEKRLHVAVDYMVRSAKDIKAVIAQNPFPDEAERDPSHLLVMFHKKAPAANDVERLRRKSPG